MTFTPSSASCEWLLETAVLQFTPSKPHDPKEADIECSPHVAHIAHNQPKVCSCHSAPRPWPHLEALPIPFQLAPYLFFPPAMTHWSTSASSLSAHKSPSQCPESAPWFWVRTNPQSLWVSLCIPNIKLWCHEWRSSQALKTWSQETQLTNWLVWLACLISLQLHTGKNLTYSLLTSPLKFDF